MYFAYFDESGDSGYINSPTPSFCLGCVLIHENNWINFLDDCVSFRRYLRAQFKVPVRSEIKAVWIVHGKGTFKNLGLSKPVRKNIFRAAMRFQSKCNLSQTFGIVVNKSKIAKRTIDPREQAWQMAIERLERFGRSVSQCIHILPDEGHGYFIRRKLRSMRRFHMVNPAYGGQQLSRAATNIIEDPSDRKSHESYFTQFADLNAYAAYRKIFPVSGFGGDVWDMLGDIRIKNVNRISGGAVGIKSWPH